SRRGKGLHSRRLLGTVSALALSGVVLGAGSQAAFAETCVTGIDAPATGSVSGTTELGGAFNGATETAGDHSHTGPLGIVTITNTTGAHEHDFSVPDHAHDFTVNGLITSVTPLDSGAGDAGIATNTACGQNAQATGGQFSSAYGANSKASGFESTALGGAATATAQWGTSVGVLA